MSSEAANNFVTTVVSPLLSNMLSWSKEPLRAPATERRDLCAACPMADLLASLGRGIVRAQAPLLSER